MSAAQIAKLSKKLRISARKAKELLEERKNKSSKTTTDRMFSNQTGAGRGKFEKGGPPAPKLVEGMGKGTKGGDAKAEAAVDAGLMGKVTMSPDANFIEAMATKSTKNAAKNRVRLEKLADEGNKKAQAIVAKIKKYEADAVDKKGRAISQSLRDRKIYEKGTYINRETGEIITNPKRASDFPDGGPNAYDFEPTAKRMESIRKSIAAKEKTPAERIKAASKDDKRSSKNIDGRIKKSKELSKNTNVVGKGGGRFSQGGLKMPSAEQTGLKKLPTPVRNKMGYMYGGGMMKKPRMSSMDYRKGGLLLIAIDMMKKKKGKKEK